MKEITFLLLTILPFCGCDDPIKPIEPVNPFEDITYRFYNRHGSQFDYGLNFYRGDTLSRQISFSDTLRSLESAYIYNSFEPDKKIEIPIGNDLTTFFINYPITPDYQFDSLKLIAVFKFTSTINLEIQLVSVQISELYTTSIYKLYNISGDLANGMYSDYLNSFTIDNRLLRKDFLLQEGTSANDVLLMNFHEGFMENKNFKHSFSSFARTIFKPDAFETLNGTMFIKLNSSSIEDFQTPSQIVNEFEKQKEKASIKMEDVKPGDLFVVRILDTWNNRFMPLPYSYNIDLVQVQLGTDDNAIYNLQYAILEIDHIYDDMRTLADGGTDNDYIAFRLLSFNPPRSGPVGFTK